MSMFKKFASVTESYQEPVAQEIQGDVYAHLTEATVGLTRDFYNVMEATGVADVRGEYAVIEGAVEPEVVIESIVKNGIARLKAMFKKFWEKLKSFYAEVVKRIKMIFMSGEKFVSEFKSELEKKKVTGYEYKGYKYKFEDGTKACTDVISKIENKVMDMLDYLKIRDVETLERAGRGVSRVVKSDRDGEIGDYDNASNKNGNLSARMKSQSDSAVYDEVEDYEEVVIKELKVGGAESNGELSTELKKIFRSGEDETETLKDFETNSKSAMMDFIKNKDKALSKITSDERTFDKALSAIIKALDGIAKDAENDSNLYKHTSNISGSISKLITIGKVATTVRTQVTEEAARQFESILKGYLKFKPKSKDGKSSVSESTSVIDDVFAHIV